MPPVPAQPVAAADAPAEIAAGTGRATDLAGPEPDATLFVTPAVR